MSQDSTRPLIVYKEMQLHKLNVDKLPSGYFRVVKTMDRETKREYFTLVFMGNTTIYKGPASEYEMVNRAIEENRYHFWTNQCGELELKLQK